MKRNQKRKGFSLLELLAVVVILGILAAAIVPRVLVSSAQAKTSVHEHNLGSINAAVERYYVEEGSLPANIAALVPNYLPDGVPDVPTDNTLEYVLDGNSRATTQAK